MQDKAIGPVRGTSTWTAAKTRRETRCFQLLGFLFLFAKPLRARDDPGEVAQPLTPPPHACTHPRAHRRWRPPNASCCNRHRAVLLVPPAPFPPAGRRERRESFSTVAKLLFVWQRLFSSLSLSLSSHSCKCSLPPFLLTAFKLLLLVAWCRLFPSAAPYLAPRRGCYPLLPENEPRCRQAAPSNAARRVGSCAHAAPFFAKYTCSRMPFWNAH